MQFQLTKREKEILALIIKEYSSEKIAAKFSLSIRTVETHRKNIMRKTGSRSLIALFKCAVKLGMDPHFVYVGERHP